VSYLRCRCVASPAVLSFFVALGSFRGFRDTVYVISPLLHPHMTPICALPKLTIIAFLFHALSLSRPMHRKPLLHFAVANLWSLFQPRNEPYQIERRLCSCRTPLYAAIAANVINLVLDLVLIFVFNMGVAGAAIATSVSQVHSRYLLLPLPSHFLPSLICARPAAASNRSIVRSHGQSPSSASTIY
jgi:hypothetical protein